MRVFSNAVLLGFFALFLSVSAQAQEYSSVPASTDQISDSVLRDALTQYSPNYNYLIRADQIRAYVNIYQSLHGVQPPLTADDSAQLTQQPVYVVPAQPQVYYYQNPPVYYQPSRPGFSFGITIGDRWGRPGWNRPGQWHRPPPHFGPGRPHPGGPGRPPSHRPRPR